MSVFPRLLPRHRHHPQRIDLMAALLQYLEAETVEDEGLANLGDHPGLIDDESYQHAGHSGAEPGVESYFRVKIVAEAFRGKSRVDQHRMVNAALAEELRERVHALAIQASAP